MVNSHVQPTAGLHHEPGLSISDSAAMLKAIAATAGEARTDVRRRAPSSRPALLGDAIATNLFMLGYAWQKGWCRSRLEALERAIELNGAAVEINKRALRLGPARRASTSRRSRRWCGATRAG